MEPERYAWPGGACGSPAAARTAREYWTYSDWHADSSLIGKLVEDGVLRQYLPAVGAFGRGGGYAGVADAVMPTLTNLNNVSIVTGASSALHGIAGNYYLDR